MSQRLKDHHIHVLLIVFAVLVGIGVLWRLLTPRLNTEVSIPLTTSAIAHYTDPVYHFSIDYDIRLKHSDTEENAQLPWRYNTQTVGTRVLTLRLPKEFQSHSNFGEGVVSVGVSADPAALEACLVPTNGEVLSSDVDPRFSVFVGSDAGAGNFYEVTSYRTIHEGRCVALERMIHSVNIGNFDESRNIREFDRSAVVEILDQAIERFRFE